LNVSTKKSNRSSGTLTRDVDGSIVQKGKFSAGTPIFVSTLNNVLFPTFGNLHKKHNTKKKTQQKKKRKKEGKESVMTISLTHKHHSPHDTALQVRSNLAQARRSLFFFFSFSFLQKIM
jgi:hypothetical protein